MIFRRRQNVLKEIDMFVAKLTGLLQCESWEIMESGVEYFGIIWNNSTKDRIYLNYSELFEIIHFRIPSLRNPGLFS